MSKKSSQTKNKNLKLKLKNHSKIQNIKYKI